MLGGGESGETLVGDAGVSPKWSVVLVSVKLLYLIDLLERKEEFNLEKEKNTLLTIVLATRAAQDAAYCVAQCHLKIEMGQKG